MRRSTFACMFLLLGGCGDPSGLLGGQEGEPLDPSAEPPAAPPPPAGMDDLDAEPDDTGGGCEPVAHCVGVGWCVEYAAGAVPDLDTVCPDHHGEGACERDGALGRCVGAADDVCADRWWYDAAAASVCES